jgi:16S rRNA (cytosine1402-N4)-methyltransferase
MHIPVMLNEVLASLAPQDGQIIVDGTFGAGGYSSALAQAARCKLVAIDRDPDVRLLADDLAREFPGHFLFVPGRFGQMLELLASEGITAVDGIVLDLGVSSMQLDQASRGFSFQHDAPLDMRMGQAGLSAYDVVNNYDFGALVYILQHYGEEKAARRIAAAILQAREIAPIASTLQLVKIITQVLPKTGKNNPATRSFQAIRMEVNAELKELEQALLAAEQILRPGGKLVVVSFHSLEDRMVKQFLRARSAKHQSSGSRHLPQALAVNETVAEGSFTLPSPEKKFPGSEEQRLNPRARSARLRMAIRTDQPAWSMQHEV